MKKKLMMDFDYNVKKDDQSHRMDSSIQKIYKNYLSASPKELTKKEWKTLKMYIEENLSIDEITIQNGVVPTRTHQVLDTCLVKMYVLLKEQQKENIITSI